MLPFETHFLQLANYWVDYRLRRALPPLRSITETKQAYTQLVEHYNAVADPTADATLTGQFDLDRFRRELDHPAADMTALFQVYARAVYASLTGEALPAVRVVEKSTENAELALDLKHLFPAAKFIHIMRNPYANVVAVRRHHSQTSKRVNFQNRFPVLITNLPALKNSYYHLYRNRRLFDAADYLVIRYEDLLTAPDATMQAVARFLSIPFTDGLLQPTSLGQAWQGNSSRGISFSGISARNLDLWRGEISHVELHYVNRYFKFVLDDYGYETLTPRRPVLWPVRREGPLAYIANRLLPFFL